MLRKPAPPRRAAPRTTAKRPRTAGATPLAPAQADSGSVAQQARHLPAPAEDIEPERLSALAQQCQLALAPDQALKLCAYARLLQRWNRVHNLTAIEDGQSVLSHHLLDCLAVLPPLEEALTRYGLQAAPGAPLHFLDAGSGGGLPGIPLAIVCPHWQATLVDAVEKKCAFLRQACIDLGLHNVRVVHGRLEQLALPRQDFVTARAFAALADIVRLTAAHLRPGGIWVALKGREPLQERAELPADIAVLDTITLRVPMLAGQRHLLILRRAGDAPLRATDS